MKKARSIVCLYSINLSMIVLLIASLAAILPAFVAGSQNNVSDDPKRSNKTLPGVYFYRFEPSFYAGFAPRCQEPRRIHIHLGRGNQLRVTVVLSDHIIDEYIPDLAYRYHVYEELINSSRISLSQNRGFEKFKARLIKEKILDLAEQKGTLDRAAYRKIALEKLQKLNPGKIFPIKIDFERRVRDWSAQLAGIEVEKISLTETLDLINAMLPTRLMITELSAETKKRLRHVISLFARYEKMEDPALWDRFYLAAVDLFTSVTDGIYPIKGKMLDFYEFTAIYSVGSWNKYGKYGGIEIPVYPWPGKRRLHIHQRTRIVDHIARRSYGYLPWIPYMHVGKRLHNSFHSLWFRIETRKNKFIPDAWRQNTTDSRTGKPYPYLWLVSRGPMSRGCTHVNAGHISEFRQLLPSTEAALLRVITYHNKSNHFDVFDINGDGKPEVMGVKYYYAYTLKAKKPHRLRAPSDRTSFYKWLYKNGYHYDQGNRLIFDRVTDSKFIGKKAVKGKTYRNIQLYEADYTPETIQFYKFTSIAFVRELRRVSKTYDLNRKVLKLDQKKP